MATATATPTSLARRSRPEGWTAVHSAAERHQERARRVVLAAVRQAKGLVNLRQLEAALDQGYQAGAEAAMRVPLRGLEDALYGQRPSIVPGLRANAVGGGIKGVLEGAVADGADANRLCVPDTFLDELFNYTGDSSSLNRSLRSGTPVPRGYKTTMQSLDDAFASGRHVTSSDKVVYRLLERSDAERLVSEAGTVFQDAAFVSTTKRAEALDDLAEEVGLDAEELFRLQIIVPKGTRAIDINKVLGRRSQFPEQHELLLDRGLSFRVVESDLGSGTATIEVVKTGRT
jgi:hypothetical protein